MIGLLDLKFLELLFIFLEDKLTIIDWKVDVELNAFNYTLISPIRLYIPP